MAEPRRICYAEFLQFCNRVVAMDNLIVSGRGQITLPAKLRKRLGIEPGGVVVAEEKDGALVLRPATVLPVRIYSDGEIERWQREDTFKDAAERADFDRRLKALAKRHGLTKAA
jgi:AbrB family looped-hinge helix DNA binding protein